MKSFSDGQRIVLSRPFNDDRQPLKGRRGHVVRLRRSDDLAWIEMEELLPDEFRSFPTTDKRANHILVDPEECDELQKSEEK